MKVNSWVVIDRFISYSSDFEKISLWLLGFSSARITLETPFQSALSWFTGNLNGLVSPETDLEYLRVSLSLG